MLQKDTHGVERDGKRPCASQCFSVNTQMCFRLPWGSLFIPSFRRIREWNCSGERLITKGTVKRVCVCGVCCGVFPQQLAGEQISSGEVCRQETQGGEKTFRGRVHLQ